MDKLEKVIKGLTQCTMEGIPDERCENCPYFFCMPCINTLMADALELLKEQQEQKEKWIRDIDLYIADAEDSAKNPAVRSGKGYAVGLSYGLTIAKEIIEGKRNHG